MANQNYIDLKKQKLAEGYIKQFRATKHFDATDFFGNSPPAVFVSSFGYPKVALAPMSPPKVVNNVEVYDDPERWFGKTKEEIIFYRQSLLRGDKKYNVNSAADPDYNLQEIQELTMAKGPVDVELELKNKPKPFITFSNYHSPMGPKEDLKKFSMSENPSIDHKIDYLVSDIDVKADTALHELYFDKISVHSLEKLLAAGLLGVKKNRKLVPTRWAITAVDSNISKKVVEEKIKFYPQINDFLVFKSSFLDNHYYVLLFPNSWCFEVMEAWKKGSVMTDQEEPIIMQDHELYKGRKNYATEVTGGYYAARIAVVEYLKKERKQAGAIIFREIGSEYDTPLGVWQVRENMRNAMEQKPLKFADLDLALSYIKGKLTIPFKYYKKKSKLLDSVKNQKKITDFFG